MGRLIAVIAVIAGFIALGTLTTRAASETFSVSCSSEVHDSENGEYVTEETKDLVKHDTSDVFGLSVKHFNPRAHCSSLFRPPIS